MFPYTTEEADWLASGPARAIPGVIIRARRQWLWRRAAGIIDLTARLATAFRGLGRAGRHWRA